MYDIKTATVYVNVLNNKTLLIHNFIKVKTNMQRLYNVRSKLHNNNLKFDLGKLEYLS